MLDLIGQTIGNYRIEALVGSGGMGQVFRARHLHLDRLAAIKVMHPDLAADPGFQTRFQREAKAAAALRHPHIVEIFDFGEQNGQFYLVMELLFGGSLRALLQHGAEPDWSLSLGLDLMKQAADALAFAHAQGMVHRDVKPDNMLLDRASGPGGSGRYVLKLGDFGLARMAGGSNLTASGVPMGTPTYMSPEQCQGLELDGRSDLYSLGIVLYEVTTGQPPFEARTLSEAVYKHVYVAPPSPCEIRPDLPTEVEMAILRCLAKNPDDRLGSAEELSAVISEVMAGDFPIRTSIRERAPLEDAQKPGTGGTVVLPAATGRTPAPAAPPPADASAVPRLRVLDQEGQTVHLTELTTAGLTVGRLPDNDVALAPDVVSRHHLRVDWDGNHVTVTDLGSSNGTILGEHYVQPHLAEQWGWNDVVRLGPFWLRLEAPQPRSQVTVVEQGSARGSQARLALTLPKQALEIAPGQSTVVEATLTNVGTVVDHLTVAVEGLPPEWLQLPPDPVQLEPGASTTVALKVTIPRSEESRAGEYPVTVHAHSRQSLEELASVQARWTILPFAESDIALSPPLADGRETASYTLTVSNQGNTDARLALGGDTDQALSLYFDQTEVALGPGESVAIGVKAKAPRRWIGSARRRSFSVQSKTADGTTVQTAAGEFVHRPFLPVWAMPIAGVFLVGVVALCVFLYVFVQAPTIESADFVPTDPAPGQLVTVRWRVTNAQWVELSPLGVKLEAGKGEYNITNGFPASTDVTIVASNWLRRTEKKVRVAVNATPSPTATGFEPVVKSFAVQPATVVAGQVTTVRLTWETENAESASIEPGIGPVETTGTRDLPAPASTTIYTLTVENAGGSVTGQARVEVLFPSPTPTLPPPDPTATEWVVIPTDTPEPTSTITPEPTETIPPTPTPTSPPTPTPTVTPTACPGPPVIASFVASPTTIAAGGSATLNWGAVTNAVSVVIDNGIGPVAAPGSVSVSPGSTTTYRLTATGCGGTVSRDATVTVVVVPVPAQQSPANGAVLRVFPRLATFTWSPVSVPGGVTYGIEIQINTGTWQPFANASGLAGTSYNMSAFLGDNQGRWRVWATSPTYGESHRSPWWTFKFNTGAAQYSGTWINDNPNTNGITKIIITNSGQTLHIHPYGKCSPTDCDWLTKSVTFGSEPINVAFSGHSLSITLNDPAGTKLKVVDSGSTGTSYFHRS